LTFFYRFLGREGVGLVHPALVRRRGFLLCRKLFPIFTRARRKNAVQLKTIAKLELGYSFSQGKSFDSQLTRNIA
jgi:hypothetical protein